MARKTYQGEKNNKSRTMNKLIQAVGIVLKNKGYTGLTVSNITAEAGVDRKLVSVYFGSVNNLIETYIKGKNYWDTINESAINLLTTAPETSTRLILENLLLTQLEHFTNDEEMQKVVLWQISENTELMAHVIANREEIYPLLFPKADQELKDQQVDLRAISSILVAGIYYLVLHTKTTNSTFCEIDLTTDQGMGRIKTTIKKILEDTYSIV
ncbi:MULTISPECIES: TetR/AcrR family transcriptional regulator [Sphingobacterium]|uniref:TetR/AcrR family transcriptional regulator n=1 Tax=Sphingobacterium kitahiroshimense TaxID=470446 RepID=A0ABV0BPA6_9SPHI|nr:MULTISPECIES: TetR/AcrR family transcriptional regulator [unclassified Sphingobacterium]MBB2954143.1 AcrR family transcriptional regulator [Sphingobacterium sp. JUb56]NJI74874.1 TetR/AcrR family transcriptional regulator [Sphingobacterium sp. B16(2022)]